MARAEKVRFCLGDPTGSGGKTFQTISHAYRLLGPTRSREVAFPLVKLLFDWVPRGDVTGIHMTVVVKTHGIPCWGR